MQAKFIKPYLFVFCILFSPPISAQQANTNLPPFNVGIHISLVGAGPGQQVYNYMERNGFGEAGGYFAIDYPNKLSLKGILDARYRLNKWFSVKGAFFLLDSWVVGHDSFRRWRVDMNLASPALLGLIHSSNRSFYVGTGPNINFMNFKSTKFAAPIEGIFRENFKKMGWVLESGWRFPANSRFFTDVQFRYAYAGKKKVGPFLFQGQSLWSDLNGSNAPDRVVPAFEVSYNTFSINIGGGIRVGKLPSR